MRTKFASLIVLSLLYSKRLNGLLPVMIGLYFGITGI